MDPFREILKLSLINGKRVLKLCIRQIQQILTDYPDHTSNQLHNTESLFDDMISIFEVQKAVNDAKFNKACGIL